MLDKVKIGMTRQEVALACGPPTDWSREKGNRLPQIIKYGDIELHFYGGKVVLIYSEDAEGNPTTHAQAHALSTPWQ